MTTYVSRWALLLALLFLLPIALIRAQPYDDSTLRALFTPPADCPAPCFLGIQPGVTTIQNSITILENHAWVAQVEGAQSSDFWEAVTMPGFAIPAVHWQWNDRPPVWLDRDRGGELWLVDGQVRHVGVYTSFLMGDVLLILGDPDDKGIASEANASGNFWSYSGWYDHQRVWVTANGQCPLRRLYTEKVLIRFQVTPPNFPDAGARNSVC